MVLGNNIVCHLNIRDQNMPISDLNPELSLDGLMDMNAGLDIDKASLVTPVGVEWDGHSLV